MNDLYIFKQDCGYRGVIIVIAKTEEAARAQMSQYSNINYLEKKPVEKEEIKEGWEFFDSGDA